MPRWGVRYGRFWMVQWVLDGGLSLGIHIDPWRRLADTGWYGPYIDLHLGVIVVSVGYHPARANALTTLLGQGGIMHPEANAAKYFET